METENLALIVAVVGWLFTWVSQVFMWYLNRNYLETQRREIKIDRAIEKELSYFEEFLVYRIGIIDNAFRQVRNLNLRLTSLKNIHLHENIERVRELLEEAFEEFLGDGDKIKDKILDSVTHARSLGMEKNYASEKARQNDKVNLERIEESHKESQRLIGGIRAAKDREELVVAIDSYGKWVEEYAIIVHEFVASGIALKFSIIRNIHKNMSDL